MFFQDCGFVLWLSVPLVASNMMPVMLRGPGPAIDGGAVWLDGRPLLGPSKTWLGLLFGLFGGLVWGLALWAAAVAFGWISLADAWGISPERVVLHILTLAIGVHVGDLIKSFFKRRRGITNGDPWPFIDQFDAVIGGFGLTALGDWSWFSREFIPGRLVAVFALCFVYYAVHRAVSTWSHRVGMKSTAH